MRFAKLALAAVLLATSLPVVAGKPVKPSKPAKPAKAVLKCPVTGEKVGSMGKNGGQSVYKGKTYYFCCPSCKPAFDANPAKYVKK